MNCNPAITCSKLTIETPEERCEICSKLTIKPFFEPFFRCSLDFTLFSYHVELFYPRDLVCLNKSVLFKQVKTVKKTR